MILLMEEECWNYIINGSEGIGMIILIGGRDDIINGGSVRDDVSGSRRDWHDSWAHIIEGYCIPEVAREPHPPINPPTVPPPRLPTSEALVAPPPTGAVQGRVRR